MIQVVPTTAPELAETGKFSFPPYAGGAWPHLKTASLHVWSISLEQPLSFLSTANRLLSADERDRAEKFRFDQHRNRFIAGRFALRSILGRYLNQKPEALEFLYPDSGKPELGFPLRSPIQFNMSHSGDVGLLAVSLAPVGVDVEQLRPIPEHLQIAKCFFTEEEAVELMDFPEPDRPRAFYRCWTRKEALLKGWGCGITRNLKAFQVSLQFDDELLLRACRPDLRAHWQIQQLQPAEGYIGAVAINSTSVERQCYHFLLDCS
jgi:4'-phosphopantetheinyl transferase